MLSCVSYSEFQNETARLCKVQSAFHIQPMKMYITQYIYSYKNKVTTFHYLLVGSSVRLKYLSKHCIDNVNKLFFVKYFTAIPITHYSSYFFRIDKQLVDAEK